MTIQWELSRTFRASMGAVAVLSARLRVIRQFAATY